MTSYKFTTLLPLESPTCPRALKSESELELLTLKFLGSPDLFVYFQKNHWCHTERKKCLRCVLFIYIFMYFYEIIIQFHRQGAVGIRIIVTSKK